MHIIIGESKKEGKKRSVALDAFAFDCIFTRRVQQSAPDHWTQDVNSGQQSRAKIEGGRGSVHAKAKGSPRSCGS